jgi:GxxExxY protein
MAESRRRLGGFGDGSDELIGACIEVHRLLGPGLLESTYEQCLGQELRLRKVPFDSQVPVPIAYKGTQLDCGYRLDLLIRAQVIIEIKAVDRLLPIHSAQVLTYLKLTGAAAALLVNFNVPILRLGLRRLTVR